MLLPSYSTNFILSGYLKVLIGAFRYSSCVKYMHIITLMNIFNEYEWRCLTFTCTVRCTYYQFIGITYGLLKTHFISTRSIYRFQR